ncbi:MAG: PadR family transcriptional regulator [Gemmatimonadota bacterium]|jgi:PadR family transcriptional regulator PadR
MIVDLHIIECHSVNRIEERPEVGASGRRSDVIKGTLDMLILQTLNREELHGWGIAKRIQQSSADVLQVNQGSLYPALYRLVERGWIQVRLGESAEGRPVKIYRLTASGRKQLETERAHWRELSAAVNLVLETG